MHGYPGRARQTVWKRWLGMIGAVACAFGTASAATNPNDVLRAQLDNGLRVIIVRNTLAPVVATSVNYLAGSDEAPDGFPGMAHAQEHMLFRGSPGLTADQLADIGSVMGGDFNANTRESLTQYLYTVPSQDLEVALHIESLRMRGADDSDKEWNQERGAIEQEVAQDFSNPDYVLYSKLRAAVFAGTPYQHDALGSRPSFEKTTGAMLKRFYDAWYAPNNAILIIVGNVDPEDTLSKVKTLFGDIPRKTLPARPAINLKPAKALALTGDTDQPNGSETLAIRVPGLDSADFPALEVLADVLDSHRFDLYGLVPQGKALYAGFGLEPLPKAGLAYATVAFPAGADAAALEKEVRGILKKVADSGVPSELVDAAKLQEKREAEFQKNTIDGLASVWADAVALYGLSEPDEDLRRIEKVTVEDVNRVARKYLDLDHAATMRMLPKGSGKPVQSSGGFGGQEAISLQQSASTTLPSWAQDALTRLSVPPSTTNPTVSQLPNGLTLIVQPEDVSDTISVYGHIRNRAEVEAPVGKEGVSNVLDQLFPFGSERLDRLAYQQALDGIGAEAHAGIDFSLKVLSKDFDAGMALLADDELHPALPQPAFDILRGQTERVVTARNSSPGYLTSRSLRTALFPKTDPSLRDATPESVHSLSLADVREYYRLAYRPDMATIVVMGHVTPEQARAAVDKYFGAWTAEGAAPATDLPSVPPSTASTVAVPDASRVQDEVTLAETMTVTRLDPDYYALELGSAVLGGGFYSTRLSIDLRKNAGLVYSVGSYLQAGKNRSIYYIDYACDPQNVSKAAQIANQELRNMQNAPPTAEEFARVKALELGRLPLGEASIDAIAHGFLQRRDLNLPLDEPTRAAQRFIELSAEDVQAAFKKWVRPDDLVRVTQGPAPQ